MVINIKLIVSGPKVKERSISKKIIKPNLRKLLTNLPFIVGFYCGAYTVVQKFIIMQPLHLILYFLF